MNTKKIIIVSALIGTAAMTWVLILRAKKVKNAGMLKDYIDSLPKENTVAAKNAIIDEKVDTLKGITDTYDVKDFIKGNPIIFSGKTYTDAKSAVVVASKIAKQIYEAVSTKNPLYMGTDKVGFASAFSQIGSKNALILVNAIYKATYKESLWEAIDGESRLYNGKGIHATLAAVFMDLAKYDKVVSDVLVKLV